MITFFKITYGGAGLIDNANAFMANDPSFGNRWNISFHYMQIRSAYGCFQDLYDRICRFY